VQAQILNLLGHGELHHEQGGMRMGKVIERLVFAAGGIIDDGEG
jgi:hypothetical protein